ncbi:DUF2470 domain-containing protein [Microbacterium atlanticum]|uniref:DUF2470 domain-containing protein n=1 Tax=Microbacterium atlanticum TaxID=2782168 RepID=UPI001887F2C7|nr:DUF2470 domain-containing protein [Microbacterium atlanticum]
MTHLFDEAALTGVLSHMNADHAGDNLLIARAFAGESGVQPATITSSTMTGFDGEKGVWTASTEDGGTLEIAVPWPGGAISQRPEVRREIVALYDEACRRLGVDPRPHAWRSG